MNIYLFYSKEEETMKRVLALCLAVMMCLGCLCAAAEETTYKVGVIQGVAHVALDSARDGFVQALKDNGLEEGKNLTLRLENGQGEVTNMSTIADQFVSDQMDLVLAIGTGAAQTMAGKTTEIPILGTAITDYVVARLVDSNEQPGGNVSGTTDINPVAEQIGLIKQFVPDAQTVGVFYTASEDNSVLQAQMAKEAIEAAGMTYVETTIINSNDVQQAAQELCGKCDAIYIPTDNILASSMPIVYGVAVEAKKVIICGESGMCSGGGLATLGINYYDLGYQTGLMAVKVLVEGADVSEMPIEKATKVEYYINATVAEELGIEIPEELKPFAHEMETAGE